jgi:protease IV
MIPNSYTKLVLVCFFILGASVFAERNFLTSALQDGFQVRAMSMGNAYTSIAESDGAIYYNPAGLSIPGAVYSYQKFDYQDAVYQEYSSHTVYKNPIGYSYMTKKNELGEHVDVNVVGYGLKGRTVSWGVNYKTVRYKLGVDGKSKSGQSTDLGVLVNVSPALKVGVMARDFFKKDLESVSSSFIAGMSLHAPKNKFILASDVVVQTNDDDKKEYYGRYGMELQIAKGLALRGGYTERTLTGGVSMILPFAQIDYGIMTSQFDNHDSQYMIAMKLGRGTKASQIRRRYGLFKPKAFAEFSLGGNLTDGKSEASLLGGYKLGSNDLLPLIRYAKDDKSCEGYIIRIGSLSSGLSSIGMIQEIRNSLKEAKKDGKKIIVYLESWATLPEYYLASIADTIIIPELGSISHLGIKVQVKKTKTLLQNFGLEKVIVSSGVHKDLLNPASDKLTAFDRGYIEDVVDSLYQQVLQEIESERDIDVDDLMKAFDGRLIAARQAKEMGLVDELAYWSDVDEIIAGEMEEKKAVKSVDILEFLPEAPGRSILHPFNRIAVLEVDGAIQLGSNSSSFLFGGKSTGADQFDQMVSLLEKEFTIRAVIIRVNSPGGGMLASDRIYEAINRLKRSGKRVYTSMGSIAASGGYYVSLNSDKILANPGTLTGSAGVISSYMNFEDFNELLGIDYDVVKTGRYMDIMSSHRALSDDEKGLIQAHQDMYYNTFVTRIMTNRHLTYEEALDVAQGQIVTGKDAVDMKMIDKVGSFYDAVDDLSKDLDIENPQVVFVRPPSKMDLPNLNLGMLSRLSSLFMNADSSSQLFNY